MEHSKTTSDGGDEANSLPFQFITEDGSGKRAQRDSAAMHAIRSQARKYGILGRQRRHAASQRLLKERHRSIRGCSDIVHMQPSRHAPDARSCTCAECTYPSNQDVEPQLSHQAAYTSLGSECVPAENESGMLTRPGKVRQTGRLHELQRQILQRLSPQTGLGAGKVDPFQCYPIKTEPYVHKLVDHYITLCKRNTTQVTSEFALTQLAHNAATVDFKWLTAGWISLAFAYPLSFYSMLLIAEADLQVSFGLDPWSFRAINLSMECTKLLQKDIRKSDEVSDAALVAVINMAFMELVYARDTTKYQSHMMEGKSKPRSNFTLFWLSSTFITYTIIPFNTKMKSTDSMSLITGLGKMVKLRGGKDKLPAATQVIINLVVQVADGLWDSGEADKADPNILFHPWWKPNYKELTAPTKTDLTGKN